MLEFLPFYSILCIWGCGSGSQEIAAFWEGNVITLDWLISSTLAFNGKYSNIDISLVVVQNKPWHHAINVCWYWMGHVTYNHPIQSTSLASTYSVNHLLSNIINEDEHWYPRIYYRFYPNPWIYRLFCFESQRIIQDGVVVQAIQHASIVRSEHLHISLNFDHSTDSSAIVPA